MRPVRVLVVAVAVLAAGSSALLARRWVDERQAAPAPVAAMPLAQVLVVARDLPMGAEIQADDLRYESWPVASAGPKLVVLREGEDPRVPFVGRISRRDLAAGEPMTLQSVRADKAGLLAGLLGQGLRAVSVAISNTSAAAGFVTPGDRVDVLLAADLLRVEGNNQSHSAPMARYAAETVLTAIKVLAIDQSTTRSRDGGAVEGKTATLEVTPKQAEILAAASMLGSLSLALRGADGGEGPAEVRPYTPDTEASRALDALHGARPQAARSQGGAQVTVNRAGQITSQSFAGGKP